MKYLASLLSSFFMDYTIRIINFYLIDNYKLWNILQVCKTPFWSGEYFLSCREVVGEDSQDLDSMSFFEVDED